MSYILMNIKLCHFAGPQYLLVIVLVNSLSIYTVYMDNYKKLIGLGPVVQN